MERGCVFKTSRLNRETAKGEILSEPPIHVVRSAPAITIKACLAFAADRERKLSSPSEKSSLCDPLTLPPMRRASARSHKPTNSAV
jgi:hypothetical protein